MTVEEDLITQTIGFCWVVVQQVLKIPVYLSSQKTPASQIHIVLEISSYTILNFSPKPINSLYSIFLCLYCKQQVYLTWW